MMECSSVGMMTFPTEWKKETHVPNHPAVQNTLGGYSENGDYRMGPPSDVSGFINHEITPMNTIVISTYIYHKATEIRQLSYLGGPILYRYLQAGRGLTWPDIMRWSLSVEPRCSSTSCSERGMTFSRFQTWKATGHLDISMINPSPIRQGHLGTFPMSNQKTFENNPSARAFWGAPCHACYE